MWLADETISTRYQNIVQYALNDENIFQSFKSIQDYNNVVGRSKGTQADVWMKNLSDNYPHILNELYKYAENDIIGNSEFYSMIEDRKISANTLRYLNTAIEIDTHFNVKNIPISVAELGVGYGGLCFVMNKYFNIKSYTLIDLPNVQSLADKYLSRLNINTQTKIVPDEIDLFVSEFCLSEFDDVGIYNFYEQYVLKSKRIYLVMNLHELDRKDKFVDTVSNDFDISIADEYPKTRWPNYIIKGTRK